MTKSRAVPLSVGSFTPVPAGVLQRKCACVGKSNGEAQCPHCRAKKEGLLQRKSTLSGELDEVPRIVHEVVRSPGQPLDPAIRSFMEPRFGHDLTNVRVHNDAMAADSASAVNAIAYTVGRHLVFGIGQFSPETSDGRQLLAHELTHAAQQRFAANDSALNIQSVDPDPRLEAEAEAAGDTAYNDISSNSSLPGLALQRQPSGRRTRAPIITDILVNQNSPQQVTATFSDGHTETGECSTGKGHCCFDDSAGTAEGGACSKARSTQVGNNCTPVGDFTVTNKIPETSGGVRLWTQFHDAKSVALHEYSPVDGTPLSHGCVRLHEPLARVVFEGSRIGVTRVRVDGLARPRCEDSALQSEWEGDFRLAGSTPPDGETINPHTNQRFTRREIAQERRHITEARTEMRSALGVDDAALDTELAAWRGGSPIASKIPRCVPALTIEEQKVPTARGAGFLATSTSATVAAFGTALARTSTSAAAERVVRRFGEQLWQDSTSAARPGGTGTDDRQLYWTRLGLTTALRQWNPSWVPNADSLRRLHTQLLNLLEQTSRGMATAAFTADSSLKRILISGFDPFGFANMGDIRQGNPSGAAALALDGEILTDGGVSAQVQSVVFPVRYADFDAGIVENFLRPQLTGPSPPHLVMSISQGGSQQFEFEEWAGRRRSVHDFRENLGRLGGGTPTRPVAPAGLASGPEFLRTNVSPALLGSMRGAVGRTSAIRGETEVTDLPPTATQPRTLPAGPSSNTGQAVTGSGGGFLSNEIFYRNSLLRTQSGSSVPMIHLHTPLLPATASDPARNTLIGTIRSILRAALRQI